jgi:hypothetical protein
MKSFYLILIVFLFSACYRMPEEDEVTVVPNTNNPMLTRQKGPSLAPGADF